MQLFVRSVFRWGTLFLAGSHPRFPLHLFVKSGVPGARFREPVGRIAEVNILVANLVKPVGEIVGDGFFAIFWRLRLSQPAGFVQFSPFFARVRAGGFIGDLALSSHVTEPLHHFFFIFRFRMSDFLSFLIALQSFQPVEIVVRDLLALKIDFLYPAGALSGTESLFFRQALNEHLLGQWWGAASPESAHGRAVTV